MRDTDKQLDNAISEATDRYHEIERQLGPDFDPADQRLDDNDRAHLAVLALADKLAALHGERNSWRREHAKDLRYFYRKIVALAEATTHQPTRAELETIALNLDLVCQGWPFYDEQRARADLYLKLLGIVQSTLVMALADSWWRPIRPRLRELEKLIAKTIGDRTAAVMDGIAAALRAVP